jgi:hypothetical protein
VNAAPDPGQWQRPPRSGAVARLANRSQPANDKAQRQIQAICADLLTLAIAKNQQTTGTRNGSPFHRTGQPVHDRGLLNVEPEFDQSASPINPRQDIHIP